MYDASMNTEKLEDFAYYHVYNRGAHKAPIFHDSNDYERMLKLLYIANNDAILCMSKLPEIVYGCTREKPFVDIVAYCLMPNHIHIAMRAQDEKKMAAFIHKLSTAYTKYYNLKYDHSGTIWQGPYKYKTVTDETYLSVLINYIHLNPYGLKEPDLKKEARDDQYYKEARLYSAKYSYSSFRDYLGDDRSQRKILTPGVNAWR